MGCGGGTGEKWEWKGTATQLLGELNEIAISLKINITKSNAWPKSPNALSRKLNEVKTILREIGIDIVRQKDGTTKTRIITITKKELSKEDHDDYDKGSNDTSDVSASAHPDRIEGASIALPRETPTIPSPPLPRLHDQDHAQNAGQTGNDVTDDNNTTSTQLSSPKNPLNYAQVQPLRTRDDRDDNCRLSSAPNKPILSTRSNLVEFSPSQDNNNSANETVRNRKKYECRVHAL
jgi:hypothetical protein